MLEFVYNDEKRKLSKIISVRYPMLGYGRFRSLLKNKDITIDGKRIKEDVYVDKGAVIRMYVDLPKLDDFEYNIETVYEDDNILVLNKPKGIETQGIISVESYAKTLCPTARAVHRLDVNTDGLIIIAKNEKIEKLLIQAIKDNRIHKQYLSAVYGRTKEQERIVAYLKKNSQKAFVKIYDRHVPGSVKIITEYKTVFYGNNFSVVDINLITGRTHQIRAQFAYLGHQVLGDGKYGREEINLQFPYKKQALTAYKIRFETTNELSYLNGKTIEIDCHLKDLKK